MRRAAAAVLVGLAALAAVGLVYGYVRARESAREEVLRVKVADLAGQPGVYEGRTVRLVLEYGKRAETDPAAEFISRSDCHLHDETGSILLFGGWQVWMQWRDDGRYASDWLDVSPAGEWLVKKAVVRYTRERLPYLEPPEGAGEGL